MRCNAVDFVACRLAIKLGISLDCLFAIPPSVPDDGAGDGTEARSLSQLIGIEGMHQTIQGRALQWDEIPAALRGSVARATVDGSWVHCVEWTQGIRRDFCSAAFQRDIMEHSAVALAYEKNDGPVMSHWLDPNSCTRFLRGKPGGSQARSTPSRFYKVRIV